jgi:hypothetical protein
MIAVDIDSSGPRSVRHVHVMVPAAWGLELRILEMESRRAVVALALQIPASSRWCGDPTAIINA